MRVVTYRRVSSSDQAESGLSLDEQNQRMDAWCGFMGFSVVERFIDSGISGHKSSRPGFLACLDMVRKKQCDVVLIYSISRFARNTIATLDAVDFFANGKNLDGKARAELIAESKKYERGVDKMLLKKVVPMKQNDLFENNGGC